ncbi:hypothetical protein COV18_00420 [Candidatus Woesearchaeota archaeon CG10_big_fil_rev_8_21_14_0_10_37_12]|nr:MAG: hypothetical protein COV18_00420 [Candidatus Woesearchaeota archaeon CG10_big_fil_rev_8_21_14_0_10_37_12]
MVKVSIKTARQQTAKSRIKTLFEEAEKRQQYAKRYITLARKIAQKNNVRIPLELRRRFCKNCNAYLIPGKNCRIRTYKQKVIIRCLECHTIKRIPVKKR